MSARQAVQVTGLADGTLIALAADGTLWATHQSSDVRGNTHWVDWRRLPPLPQAESRARPREARHERHHPAVSA